MSFSVLETISMRPTSVPARSARKVTREDDSRVVLSASTWSDSPSKRRISVVRVFTIVACGCSRGVTRRSTTTTSIPHARSAVCRRQAGRARTDDENLTATGLRLRHHAIAAS